MNNLEFLVQDRIAKIKSMNEELDLEHNSFVSFSGGSDSTVLHYLIDEALPQNKIPRVYSDTGIEYKLIRKFVKEKAEKDDRFIILKPTTNIRETLETYGYPFKSKEYSERLCNYKKGYRTPKLLNYFRLVDIEGKEKFRCPKRLLEQIDDNYKLKISDKCCTLLKEKPIENFQKKNGLKIAITGIRKAENGRRSNSKCITKGGHGRFEHFNPLVVCDDEFMRYYRETRNIKLADLYYPPYNFQRTGCKGCPFNNHLRQDLNIMKKYLPDEAKTCELLWKPVYDEYKRLGFRLKPQRYDKN